MHLVIDDHVELDTTRLSRYVKKALELLNKLPDGKLITRAALASRTGVCFLYTRAQTTHPALADHQILWKNATLFGNTRTIAEARKQLFA